MTKTDDDCCCGGGSRWSSRWNNVFVSATWAASTNPWQVPSPYYEKCENVWGALGHPITRFDPGYREGLDRNKDGIACEHDPRKKKP